MARTLNGAVRASSLEAPLIDYIGRFVEADAHLQVLPEWSPIAASLALQIPSAQRPPRPPNVDHYGEMFFIAPPDSDIALAADEHLQQNPANREILTSGINSVAAVAIGLATREVVIGIVVGFLKPRFPRGDFVAALRRTSDPSRFVGIVNQVRGHIGRREAAAVLRERRREGLDPGDCVVESVAARSWAEGICQGHVGEKLYELLADAWSEIIVVPIEGGLAIQFCRDNWVFDYSVVVHAPKSVRQPQPQPSQRGRKGAAWNGLGNLAPMDKPPSERVDDQGEPPPSVPQPRSAAPPPRPSVPQTWKAAWPKDEIATIPLPEWVDPPAQPSQHHVAPAVDERAAPDKDEGDGKPPAPRPKGGAWATAKIAVYDEAVDGTRVAPGLQKMLNDRGRKPAGDDRRPPAPKPGDPSRQTHGTPSTDQDTRRPPLRPDQTAERPPQPRPDQQTDAPPPPRAGDAGRAAWSKVTSGRGANRGGQRGGK